MVGGEGEDRLGLTAVEDRRWRLDLARGTWTSDRGTRLEFTEIEGYGLGSNGAGRRIDVRGSRESDDLTITGDALGELRLGGGSDSVLVYDQPTRRALVDGGRGRDELLVWMTNDERPVLVDLVSSRWGSATRPQARVRGVEDVSALAQRRLELRGDARDNVLRWSSCEGGGEVRGGPGDDVLGPALRLGDRSTSTMCEQESRAPLRAHGGAGDDRLLGTPYRDVLAGDRGRDRADGAAGRDRCPGVEVRRSC